MVKDLRVFMTLKECYRILDLPKTADLDEIKKAYRRLAFELHPDLNPGKPDASRHFQEVNEAYVLLTRTLEEENRRDPRVQHRRPPEAARPKPQAQSQGQPQGQPQAGPRPGPQERPRPQGQAQTNQAQTQGQTQAQSQARRRFVAGAAASRHGYAGSTGPAASRPKPGGTAGVFGQAGPRAEQYGPASPGTGVPGGFDSRDSGRIFNSTDNGGPASGAGQSPIFDVPGRGKNATAGNAYAKQEEVLGEILNDPFARRVFEDIYSELKKERGPAAPAAPVKAPRPKKKTLSLEWGKRKMSVDLTHGVSGAVKAWLRGQLDQEQVLEMPAAGIVPGARLRLQVGVGLFGHSQSVEVILPPDYTPGTPIRLKGLGRKLGSWRGDLYLRVVPQGSQNN